MVESADILSRVCHAIERNSISDATSILKGEYPFVPLQNGGRKYTAAQSMGVFVRDGFVDRYTGKRLVFPGSLRLLSTLLPHEFPFHNNWKTDQCHFAYYELYPSIDHLVPISRGGMDSKYNLITTSMVKNAAKSNFTLEELGWQIVPPGNLNEWDGLTSWFLDQYAVRGELQNIGYFRRWADAARRSLKS